MMTGIGKPVEVLVREPAGLTVHSTLGVKAGRLWSPLVSSGISSRVTCWVVTAFVSGVIRISLKPDSEKTSIVVVADLSKLLGLGQLQPPLAHDWPTTRNV